MISFKELKILIAKCCKVESKSDLSERFSFEIDFANMEKRLQEIDPQFHVLSFNTKAQSYVPCLSDIQLLTEYLHTADEMKNVLNGSSNIYTFMIYSTLTPSGFVYKLHNDNGKVVAPEDLFALCNGENVEFETIKEIVSKLPVYQILVVRTFSKKQDKFEYKFYFRSNYEMITLFKSLQNNTEETVEATEE